MKTLNHFGKYLKKHNLDPIAVAKDLGMTKTYIYMLSTKTTPSLALAARIEKWSKGAITMQSWVPEILGATK